MIIPTWMFKLVFWLFNPRLYKLIQQYHFIDDKLMPLAYQNIPGGRPLHNDWGFMTSSGILKWLQPWQRITRISTSYRIPLPFKIVKGENKPAYRVWDMSYPQSEGVKVQSLPVGTPGGTYTLPMALTDDSGAGLVTWAGYMGGKWINCFWTYRGTWFGKSLQFYYGIQQDLTVSVNDDGTIKSDLMCYFPGLSVSYTKLV